MLRDKVCAKLNDQMNFELYSAYIYLSMAAYFESVSLKGFAHWMKAQAHEEMAHVMRFFNYIHDRRARARLDAIDAPTAQWDSPLAAMKNAYDHECIVSDRINGIVSLTLEEQDHSTAAFLQWFVNEQIEEEANADEVVQKLKLVGDNPSGLFLLDTDLNKRVLNLAAIDPANPPA